MDYKDDAGAVCESWMNVLKLAIVDDHVLVRIGVTAVVAEVDDIEMVGSYENAESALRAFESLKPNVVLMGVEMTGMDGVHACRHLRSMLPDVNVIMLTSHSDEETVMASIMAGASGYLLKNTSVDRLLRAVRTVAGGGSLLDPAITRDVLDRFKSMTTPDAVTPPGRDNLSKRESEVFSLIVEGCTNREIGERLYISQNTARNHVSHILHKLGLNRRGQAAVFGLAQFAAPD